MKDIRKAVLPIRLQRLKDELKRKLYERRELREHIEDLDGLIARIAEPMNKKQIQELAEKHGHGSAYLVKKQWSEIESRLVKAKDRRYQQPTK